MAVHRLTLLPVRCFRSPHPAPALSSTHPTQLFSRLVHSSSIPHTIRKPAMTLIHIVLFKFRPEITAEHKATFVRELKKLKALPCVKNGRLLVGGPSVTEPIEKSKGFQYALVSYHQDRKALEEYQASKEHHWVTSTYMFPFKEDLCRFDFEVDEEDEYMCGIEAFLGKGKTTEI